MSENQLSRSIWILIPTYNDWEALALLIESISGALARRGLSGRVLIVDDGSTKRRPSQRALLPGALELVEVLRLRRNLGHQRAIAVGLCHLVEHHEGSGIIIMDGDGEDQPTDIPRLLDVATTQADDTAVFAARLRRSEGMTFALFYHLYRMLHWLLTGVAVRMGNFSYLPWQHADRLVVCSELWNHYAAAVVHSRIPYEMLPTERGRRLTGKSTMNLVGLVAHGLSAMAVFSDRIGARALAVSGAAFVVALLSLGTVLAVRWGTELALPGWATSAAGLLVVFVAQIVMLSTLFTFVVLAGRSQTAVVPLRDYRIFVRDLITW